MGVAEFKTYLEEVAEKFSAIPKSTRVKVVSNLDADGISACSIVLKMLIRDERKYSFSIIHQLREKELAELKEEDHDFYIFSDLGSGTLDLIQEYLGDKKVLILDHHHPNGEEGNAWHVNPHLFGINGSEDVSASGVCFFFARTVSALNDDMAPIALVGAIGDVQEKEGFHGLNKDILEIATKKGFLEVKKGLKLFGLQTRPVHKLLEYSSDINIPGVTNSESGAVQFLTSLGINPKKDKYNWKLMKDLTEKEKKRLVAGIIVKRNGLENPGNIFTNLYTLPKEKGAFRSLREFSTLLNACGRLGKAGVGVGACLGSEKFKKKVLEVHKEYKREIVGALNWFRDNKNSDKVMIEDGYVIINAGTEVKDTMIGTLISILSMGRDYPENTLMLSMARKQDGVSKISIRVSGSPDIHLREIISEIAGRVGGEAGGHQFAAGAIIPLAKEDEFIEASHEVLGRVAKSLKD